MLYSAIRRFNIKNLTNKNEEIYRFSMNEVPNLWCKLGSLPWDEHGFDEVVDGIDWNLGSRMIDDYYKVISVGQI